MPTLPANIKSVGFISIFASESEKPVAKPKHFPSARQTPKVAPANFPALCQSSNLVCSFCCKESCPNRV
ncbi:MAG: hypothetical protein HC846_10075 [Blastocatellia bacterium]|nr:hypothetical protein [Blastocatellia bacterium]